MVGNGLQGVLLGVRAEQLGFGDVAIGLVMGGYFVGYLGGSFLVPKLVSHVGHIRVFGVMAALASASILVHPVAENSVVWLAVDAGLHRLCLCGDVYCLGKLDQ